MSGHTHDHNHDHDHEGHEHITLIDDQGNETLYEILLTVDGTGRIRPQLRLALSSRRTRRRRR